MWKRLLLGLAVSLLGTSWSAAAGQLSVGDPAPKIAVKEFVKGKPVSQFEKGKLYVVEFWATWCGPCRVSIPHLTELQKDHKDVTFIGVSVWERDQDAVKPFVEKMGDKMAYRVAMDAMKPDPGKGDEEKAGSKKATKGIMAETWMEAAGQGGIPTAFIVNKEGKIAWIGHPMEMDKPLKEIVAGKWDLAVAAADFKKKNARQAKLMELSGKLGQFRTEPMKAVAAIDEAVKEDPELEDTVGFTKFQLLRSKKGDPEKALKYGERLVEKYKDDARRLNFVAWTVVQPGAPKADAKLAKLALEAARQADDLAKGKDANIADTLARAYFETGDAAKAVKAQERAVKLAKDAGGPQLKELQKHLDEYKKAAEKKEGS